MNMNKLTIVVTIILEIKSRIKSSGNKATICRIMKRICDRLAPQQSAKIQGVCPHGDVRESRSNASSADPTRLPSVVDGLHSATSLHSDWKPSERDPAYSLSPI